MATFVVANIRNQYFQYATNIRMWNVMYTDVYSCTHVIHIVYYGAIWHKAIVAIKLERPSDNIKNDNVVLQRPH